jgi:hypothetical protein
VSRDRRTRIRWLAAEELDAADVVLILTDHDELDL